MRTGAMEGDDVQVHEARLEERSQLLIVSLKVTHVKVSDKILHWHVLKSASGC